MTDLVLAKELADKIRFEGENKNRKNVIDNNELSSQYKDELFINGLEVNKDLTPTIEILLEEVCKKLFLNRNNVSAFVYNSLEYQASCLIVDEGQCVLKLSSNLIKDMEEKELQFIIGHELGHFLLTHGVIDNNMNFYNINRFKRAQEVSVDRLGLISCGDINIAAQTIIKMISGLNKKYIRFDVNKYLTQLTKVSKVENSNLYMSSHPSMIVRLKALLWFTMNISINDYKEGIDKELMSKVDENVQNDLNKYIEKPIIEAKKKLNNEISLWVDLKDILNHGKFSKNEQVMFKKKYGESKLNKTLNFLRNNNKVTINKHVNNQILIYKNKLNLY